MMFRAYVISSSKTDMVYVGITTQTIHKRWAQHKRDSKHGQRHLHTAMRELGITSFRIEEIMCSTNYRDLLLCEIALIEQFDSHRNGFNSTSGGQGCPGHRWKASSRKHMSEVRHALWKSESYRQKISASQKEAWVVKSPELVADHKRRAANVMRRRFSEPKEKLVHFGPYKGKGFNMMIKTHCPQGHPYDGENTLYLRSGRVRKCKACKMRQQNERRARQRAAGLKRAA